MASSRNVRQALIADVERGGVTLVLGAGVSGACKVATWRELATKAWRRAFGGDLPEVADDPRFYPFVFERVQQAIPEEFARELKRMLYAEHELPTRSELERSQTNTLAVVARVIAHEARLRSRHVVRVITLNVDDVLERAVARLAGDSDALRPVVRATFHPTHVRSGAVLPVYHLHGYLRSEHGADADAAAEDAPDVLVFTDLQYWASAAMPSSHMNRTFSFALHDSHCVFIGMSMTDLNVWRWLALRAFEIATDCKSQCDSDAAVRDRDELYRRSLDRHYWITPQDEREDDFLGECLALRGVRTVPITSWQDTSFFELMRACFPHALER